MGQISVPGKPGITVLPIDRETGPGAGAGNSGNDTIFLGAGTGQNNTAAQIIGIGNNVLSAGIIDANLAGTIAIGPSAGAALLTGVAGGEAPNIFIGRSVAAASSSNGANVMIGDQVLSIQNSGSTKRNVLIGSDVGYNLIASLTDNVIIGQAAMVLTGGGNAGGENDNVIIGAQACGGYTGNGLTSAVVIGYQAGYNLGGGQGELIIIGAAAMQNLSYDINSTYIGNAIGNAGVNGNNGGNTFVGAGAACGGYFNTGIGANCEASTSGFQNVAIGFTSGSRIGANASYILDISVKNGPASCLIYGNFSNGNLLLGNSTANLDLDAIGSTNGVKLFNGTRGAGNPTGGGFFYVNAGALHWVGSAGTDTTIAVA